MAITGVKNAAMRAGRGLAKARNQGATYAAGGMINANPAAATGMANAAPRAMVGRPAAPGRPGMKKGGKTKC